MTKAEALHAWLMETYPEINWVDYWSVGYVGPISKRNFILIDQTHEILLPYSVGNFGSIEWKKPDWAYPDFFEKMAEFMKPYVQEIHDYERKLEIIS